MRFKEELRALWLVAYRNELVYDVRCMLIELVRKNIFKWETELLRDALAARHALYENSTAFRMLHHIAYVLPDMIVERAESFVGDDASLRLRRMLVRTARFSRPRYRWFWLRDHE